jgi:hypothetical protein
MIIITNYNVNFTSIARMSVKNDNIVYLLSNNNNINNSNSVTIPLQQHLRKHLPAIRDGRGCMHFSNHTV